MTGPGAFTTLAGHAYPPGSSRRIAARLVLSESGARVLDDAGEELARCQVADLAVDPPLDQAARRITLPDGTLFQTADTQAADRLVQGSAAHRLHRAERFSPRLILVVLAALIGAVAVWRLALPVLVAIAVVLTPQPLRRAIDAGILQGADFTIAGPSRLSAGEQDRARAIQSRLVRQLPTGEGKNLVLLFRSIPRIGPNAVALPGGTIVLTDALLRDFDDQNVIAGVLSHEIGHVVDEHGLRQLYRSLGLFALVAMLAGDPGPILEDIFLEGGLLLSLSYSRANEARADAFAVDLTRRAGFDPAGLIRFFEALPDAGGEDGTWLSSHPGTGERIESIRGLLGER
jgi:Zn-dependent protease with chaperone function